VNAANEAQPEAARVVTVGEALDYAELQLLQRLPGFFDERAERRAEARALLRLAAGYDDARIYARPEQVLDSSALRRFHEIVQRRGTGEPLAYIEGHRGFHAIDLRVDPRVLVPRPETELLVDTVIALAPPQPFTVLDIGTGSGAIALAVARARSDAKVTGVDLSPAALEVAILNADALGISVEWAESDWFSGLSGRTFDFICCNPPYVRSDDPHLAQLAHEPRLALEGGVDGLAQIRRVLEKASEFLQPGGRLLLEHGYDQANDVARLAERSGLRLQRLIRDWNGHARVSQFAVSRRID